MKKREVTPGSENVFADLQLDAPEELQARARLMEKVAALLNEMKLTQGEAAKLLGIAQPRVSALINGKLSLFSTEKLLEFLTALGSDIDIVVKSRSQKRRGRIHVVSRTGS